MSALYFADVLLKASRKYFWFDELFTVYLCRLPSWQSTWTAVKHGADFNPPLLYLLTRIAQRFFGQGLISTRLPAAIGVWLFCLCLFLFVARRVGGVSGFIAGAFPFFTLVQYYAYEARAHGIVLGWCGLALVSWQGYKSGRNKHLWLAAFALSLVGALLTHVYAVYLLFPFVLVEVFAFLRAGRPNWLVLATMALVFISVVGVVYLPMSRVYRKSVLAVFSPATHDLFQKFMIEVIGPSLVIFLLLLLLIMVDGRRNAVRTYKVVAIPTQEVVLAIGFLCIPLLGLLGCKISRGPFFDRYFLATVAGYAILLGFVSSSRCFSSWVSRGLAGCMFLLILADWGSTLYFIAASRLILFEPSTGLRLSTTSSNPMRLYESLMADDQRLDILVLSSFDYIHCAQYAVPSVASHLYYGASENDINRGGFDRLVKETHIDLKTTSIDPFLAAHSHFLLYEVYGGPALEAAQGIAKTGYKLKSAQGDLSGILYEYER